MLVHQYIHIIMLPNGGLFMQTNEMIDEHNYHVYLCINYDQLNKNSSNQPCYIYTACIQLPYQVLYAFKDCKINQQQC